MNSPYKPPESPLRDVPSSERGSTFKAVALGLIADVGGTIVFGLVSTFIIGIVLAIQGWTAEQFMTFSESTGFQIFGLFYGSAFTCLGGYIAARIANHAEYRHGLYLGIASLLTGLVLMQFTMEDSRTETWVDIVSFLLLIPAAIYGAHLRLQQKRVDR